MSGLHPEGREHARGRSAEQIIERIDGSIAHDGARLHQGLVAPGRAHAPASQGELGAFGVAREVGAQGLD